MTQAAKIRAASSAPRLALAAGFLALMSVAAALALAPRSRPSAALAFALAFTVSAASGVSLWLGWRSLRLLSAPFLVRLRPRHSMIDHVTGLLGPTYLRELLYSEAQHSRRHRSRLTVLRLRLARTQALHDSLGPMGAAQVVRDFAAFLLATVRDSDIGGRTGDEEFSIVLSGNADAEVVAARLRRRMTDWIARQGLQDFDLQLHVLSTGIDYSHGSTQAAIAALDILPETYDLDPAFAATQAAGQPEFRVSAAGTD